jgi:hypothetical protein
MPWVVLSIYSRSATVHFLRFLWGRKREEKTAFACCHIYYLLPHALFINLHKHFLLQVASVLIDRVLIKLDIQASVVVLMFRPANKAGGKWFFGAGAQMGIAWVGC